MPFAFTWPRLAYPQRNSRERDSEGQQREADIGASPPDALDEEVGKLRDNGATQSHSRHSNTESESAPRIEPGRDGLCITERRLDRARHFGKRKNEREHPERSGARPHKAQANCVHDEAGQRYAANAPAVHHAPEDRYRKGGKDPADREGE